MLHPSEARSPIFGSFSPAPFSSPSHAQSVGIGVGAGGVGSSPMTPHSRGSAHGHARDSMSLSMSMSSPKTPSRSYRRPPAHLTDRRRRVEDALAGYKARRADAMLRNRGLSDPAALIATTNGDEGQVDAVAKTLFATTQTTGVDATLQQQQLHPSQLALAKTSFMTRAIADGGMEDDAYLRALRASDLEDRRLREISLAKEAAEMSALYPTTPSAYTPYAVPGAASGGYFGTQPSSGLASDMAYEYDDQEEDEEDEDDGGFFFALASKRATATSAAEEEDARAALHVAQLERELKRIERLEAAWERYAAEAFQSANGDGNGNGNGDGLSTDQGAQIGQIGQGAQHGHTGDEDFFVDETDNDARAWLVAGESADARMHPGAQGGAQGGAQDVEMAD